MITHLRSIVEGVAQGHSSVSSNPLRAGLGALAVAVAVAAVVVVVTALDGLTRYAQATGARAFGSDTFLLAQIATAPPVRTPKTLPGFELPKTVCSMNSLAMSSTFVAYYTGWGPLGSGEFWSHIITGHTVYLQLRQYGPAGPEKLGAAWFDLTDVGHVAQGFGRAQSALSKTTAAWRSFSAACSSPSARITLARRRRSASACLAMARIMLSSISTCLISTLATLMPQMSVC